MIPSFSADTADAIPLFVVTPDTLDDTLAHLPETEAAWARTLGFTAKSGTVVALPGHGGKVSRALVGLGAANARKRNRFAIAAAAAALPEGTYRLESNLSVEELNEAALGWLLASYTFDRYAKKDAPKARLIAPEDVDAARIEAIAAGEFLTRDLVNTPSSDMGPEELEVAARHLAEAFGASISVTLGDDLLAQDFPMIHTVGRASTRAPRLIDLSWGSEGPSLTLVGKGVCFDTGGLDLKSAATMALMKKDMGGAATVLGLARMIMATAQPIRLRVLIPAVENAVSGNAFRPGDILKSRKGLTVEINNTDAEGRLVLADALAFGSEAEPDLMISMATLTGAARVALGPDVAPFFTDSDSAAAAIAKASRAARDPVWRMPFHDPYEALIEPGIADLDNAPGGGMAGAITAALFLRRFASVPYAHFDIFCWQPTAARGRPKGGVGQGARALFEALPDLLNL
jgi:leucyl aminopeptidase